MPTAAYPRRERTPPLSLSICFLIDFAALLYAKGFKLLALDCERTPNTATSYGQQLEAYVRDQPCYAAGPEALLPPWALAIYRQLHHELVMQGAGEGR